MPNLDLPDLDELPTLDDSEALKNLRDAIADARERREALRERSEEIQETIPQKKEEIDSLRVGVATGENSEEQLDEAKSELESLEAELEDIRQNELPGQEETCDLLRDRLDEVKSEEGDKLADQYAEAQRELQATKRTLLRQLAEVCEALDEYQSLKKSNEVGSYDPDVQDVPQVHGVVKGQRRNEDMEPKQLRIRAEALSDTLQQIDSEE